MVSGAIGPRGDGYIADTRMSAAQARDYHRTQIETFAGTDADMVAAFTMNYVEEAIGIVSAAKEAAMPVAISFTLETDGCLPSGDALEKAILRTDEETGGYASYFMINCAHPTHFRHVLEAAHGSTVFAACVRTLRSAVTRNSTRARISTRATRSSWATSTASCRRSSRSFPWWVAAAARITVTWMRYAPPCEAQGQRSGNGHG